jgi:hypothetical protein
MGPRSERALVLRSSVTMTHANCCLFLLSLIWHHTEARITHKNTKSSGGKTESVNKGNINTGTRPSRLGKSRIWDSKMWSWFPRDSVLRMTALARTSSNCKRRTHRIHGRIPKTEFTDGSTAVSSTILETPEDDQCWSKHVVCKHQWYRRDFKV